MSKGLSFYALDDTSGTTHALRASRASFDIGRWATDEATRISDDREGETITYDVMRIDDPTTLAAWLTGDGSRLPSGTTWKTAATYVGELAYEYPGEYVWRPVTTPDTSGTPFHDDGEPREDFAPVD